VVAAGVFIDHCVLERRGIEGVIEDRCIEIIVQPSNRWMELTGQNGTVPAGREEQGRRHFVLQLIQCC
jgi:hypothetical protein